MADTEIDSIQENLVWNNVKVYIKDFDAEDTEWVWLDGIAEFTPPAQAFNAVDIPYLNQEDGITWGEKGSRAGGDISGTFNAKNSETAKAAATALKEARDDTSGVYSFKWEFPNGGIYALLEKAKVLDFSLQGGSLDTAVSYALSVRCNSLVKCFKAAESV